MIEANDDSLDVTGVVFVSVSATSRGSLPECPTPPQSLHPKSTRCSP
jgi:hypothetical protein